MIGRLVAVSFVLIVGCASGSPARSSPRVIGKACTTTDADCALASRCENGVCRESECHDALGGLSARACVAGKQCLYEDGYAIEHHLGYCDQEELK
jgi:hypothetical protein